MRVRCEVRATKLLGKVDPEVLLSEEDLPALDPLSLFFGAGAWNRRSTLCGPFSDILTEAEDTEMDGCPTLFQTESS